MDKKNLSELDIRTKFITPGIVAAGWDINDQIREDYYFTAGRMIERSRAYATYLLQTVLKEVFAPA